MTDLDGVIRAAAFTYVDQLTQRGERALTWAQLNGFSFNGSVVPLAGHRGIFKPAVLELPISIRTSYHAPDDDRPYDDEVDTNGYLRYGYRGSGPNEYQNQWLRRARYESLELLYFIGVAQRLYHAHAALITEDYPDEGAFGVQLLPIEAAAVGPLGLLNIDVEARRHYMGIANRRAAQALFRENVIDAYSGRCAMCRLRHRPLLDAATILPESLGGNQVVPNGLAMCKIHQSAFEADIIGVRPDHVIEVHPDILGKRDGQMFRRVVQDLHGTSLYLPRVPGNRPARDALEQRYLMFRNGR